jgi:hypothetical protein
MFSKDLSINLRQEEMLKEKRDGPRKPPRDIMVPSRQQHAPSETPEHILYIWSGDKNSHQALNISRNTPDIHVIDVKTLPKQDIAPWLVGVPTLLCVNEKEVFRGSKCLDKISSIADMISSREPPFMERESMPMIPQPQMRRTIQGDDSPDVNALPHFAEPENESEKDKEDLKQAVEAIMARREKIVGTSQ